MVGTTHKRPHISHSGNSNATEIYQETEDYIKSDNNNYRFMKTDDKIIISVGRQLGSGGRIIAKMLAEEFGCKFFDREVLNLAARESGFSEEFFERNDERKGFLDQIFHMHVPFISDSSFYDNGLSQENLFRLQSDAIRKAASLSSCVFVGRCADYVLREHKNMVTVFITADIEERINNICKRHNCSPDSARKIITNKEGTRSSYYNYYTGKTWGDSASYDLCVNSSRLGLEGTKEFIADFIRRTLQTL